MGGSEDGRVIGWDVNSQKVLLNQRLVSSKNTTTPIEDPTEIATMPPSTLVSSVDHQAESDIVGSCGSFPGIHLFHLDEAINEIP